MKHLGLVFIAFVLFYYVSVEGIWPPYLCEIDINQTSHSFEYFMFVQQAPAAICQFIQCNKEYNENTKLWTIHGLWPSNPSDLYPEYCEPMPFDIPSLSSILLDMERYWPGLIKDSISFWSHEWCKHGTCSSSVNLLNTQYKYFKTVLDMYEKYNYETILKNSGIVPSSTVEYDIRDFHQAFLSSINVTAFFQCNKTTEMQYQTIYQIAVCFDKQLMPISCGRDMFLKENNTCDQLHKVHYEIP